MTDLIADLQRRMAANPPPVPERKYVCVEFDGETGSVLLSIWCPETGVYRPVLEMKTEDE